MTRELLDRTAEYVAARRTEFDEIAPERRLALQSIADYVRARLDAGETARLLCICTHNSRRSHMAQAWAHIAACQRGLELVETYSGGTEATALEPRAAAALERAGLGVERASEGANALYRLSYAAGAPPLELFSKTIRDPANPREAFCAVMTCNAADEACPIVPGATLRVSLPYDDPKLADGRADETEVYDERCAQICREMLYAFSLVEAQ